MTAMVIKKSNNIIHHVLFLVLICLFSSPLVAAQTAATTQTPSPRRPAAGPVIVERRPTARQVVTVLHRLNGLKMLRLLLRSGGQVGIENLDEDFEITGRVHTNIIAGLALDDGQTIVAWLPEAEVEVEAPFAPFRGIPTQSPNVGAATPKANPSFGSQRTLATAGSTAPDLTVIERDGRRHVVRYVGLDGITGLSLLRLTDRNSETSSESRDPDISLNQTIRLFSPEPAPGSQRATNDAIYVRVGETEGRIVNILRGTTGAISRIRIRSPRLSQANIGGIAVNDAGQTIGIINSVEGNEASVLPQAIIRRAATRVLAKQASVPGPWLGVSGAPVAATPLDKFVGKGWEMGRAMALIENKRGILLTSIAPGSPAATAALRPGDVIVRVNNREIKSTDEFSLWLDEAGGNNPVRFTLVRPDGVGPESVMIRLSEAFDPQFTIKMFEGTGPRSLFTNPLASQGIEAVPLGPAVSQRFGASGGLLVVFVQPETAASKSGLQAGDVIEAINGEEITPATSAARLQELSSAGYVLIIVRNKQKLVLTVFESPK